MDAAELDALIARAGAEIGRLTGVAAIPRAIEGVGRADPLRRMKEVLRQHGSESLVEALAHHEEEIIALADTFDDLRELTERFEREADGRAMEEATCGAG